MALEQVISELILDNQKIDIADSIIQKISEPETSKGHHFDPSQIKHIVQTTCLSIQKLRSIQLKM